MPKLYPKVLNSFSGDIPSQKTSVMQIPEYEDQGVKWQTYSKLRTGAGFVLNPQQRFYALISHNNDAATTYTYTHSGQILFITRIFLQHNSIANDIDVFITNTVVNTDDAQFFYQIYPAISNQAGRLFLFDPPLTFPESMLIRVSTNTGVAEYIKLNLWGYKEKKN